MKVILKFDVYRHPKGQARTWERQVWIGEMPARKPRSEYDPLLLQREYEFGAENVIFRLDDVDEKRNEVSYRPLVTYEEDPFLEALPNWGFMKQSIVNVEEV